MPEHGAQRWSRVRPGANIPSMGTYSQLRMYRRKSQIYTVRDGEPLNMETLPDLLPEGLRPNDRDRAVCTERLLLPGRTDQAV